MTIARVIGERLSLAGVFGGVTMIVPERRHFGPRPHLSRRLPGPFNPEPACHSAVLPPDLNPNVKDK